MKKLLAAITAALLLGTLAVPTFANNPATPPTAGADSKYAEVSGENEVKFNKYLISEDGQDLGDLGYEIKFTYVVSPGQSVAATDDKFEVKAGPMPEGDDEITVTTAEFTNSSPDKHSSVQTGDNLTLDSGKVYQKQEVTIDFSKVKFPEPGIYRYVLTEQEISGATGIHYDTQKGSDATAKVRIVDVYVVDTEETGDGTPKLKIESTVIHEVATTVNTTADKGSKDEKAGNDGELADKSDGYVNEVDPVYDLHFSKEVTGNQGSRDKYFKYDLNITGLDPNQIVDITGNFTKEVTEEGLKNTATKYSHTVINTANVRDDVLDTDKWMFVDSSGNQVTKNNAGGNFTGADGNGYFDSEEAATSLNSNYGNRYTVVKVPGRTGQQLKADSSGAITWTVYLKHGEYVSVLNLKKDASYAVTEDAEDYKSAEKNNIEVGKVDAPAAKWYVIATPGTDLSNSPLGLDISGYLTDTTKGSLISSYAIEDEDWFVDWGELQGTPGQACQDDAFGTMTKNTYTGFTNTRDGIIPTGVAMGFGGALLLIGAAVIYLVIRRRSAAYED